MNGAWGSTVLWELAPWQPIGVGAGAAGAPVCSWRCARAHTGLGKRKRLAFLFLLLSSLLPLTPRWPNPRLKADALEA